MLLWFLEILILLLQSSKFLLPIKEFCLDFISFFEKILEFESGHQIETLQQFKELLKGVSYCLELL